MESIVFENKEYPLRLIDITFDDTTTVEPISVVSLEKELMTKDFDGWTSKEAKYIDEKIFLYVQDEEISLSDSGIRKIVEEAIC